jgi:DNA-binding MarR family transcriptional regulator
VQKFKRVEQDFRCISSIQLSAATSLEMRESELAPYGITIQSGRVIYAIKYLEEKATASEISKLICRKPHSVFEILHRMEARGLVRRNRRNISDNLTFTLTEKGEQVFQNTFYPTLNNIHDLLSFMSDEEEEELINKLLEIIKRVSKKLGTPTPEINDLSFRSFGDKK